MKVPSDIKKAIRNKAKASAEANKNDAVIRNWFIKNNINNDSVLDPYIDSCEMGNHPDTFIEHLESDWFKKGNSKEYEDDET